MSDLLSTNARRCIATACVLLVISGALWIFSGREEAVGQGQTTTASPAPASPSPSSPSAASPTPALEDFGSLLDAASASPFAEEEEEPVGIQGLGAVELVSGLDGFFRPEDFRCEGPVAGDETYTWVCSDPSGSYGLEVIGDDPLAVLSVTATARGVPDEDAERFFSYVLGLSVGKAADALDAEAFVAGAVPSGGTTFAGDTEISVYGDGEARAMTVASTGTAPD